MAASLSRNPWPRLHLEVDGLDGWWQERGLPGRGCLWTPRFWPILPLPAPSSRALFPFPRAPRGRKAQHDWTDWTGPPCIGALRRQSQPARAVARCTSNLVRTAMPQVSRTYHYPCLFNPHTGLGLYLDTWYTHNRSTSGTIYLGRFTREAGRRSKCRDVS